MVVVHKAGGSRIKTFLSGKKAKHCIVSARGKRNSGKNDSGRREQENSGTKKTAQTHNTI